MVTDPRCGVSGDSRAVNEPDFVVYGRAYPKGSKTVTRSGAVIEAHPSRHKDKDERRARNLERTVWPEVVQGVASQYLAELGHHKSMREPRLPVNVCAVFYMPHPKTGRQRTWHTSAPDLDKLLRGVCDPLTRAGLWHVDSQVVSFNGSAKRYALKGAPVGHPDGPRVEIAVRVVREE